LQVREDPSHVIAIRVGKLGDSVNPNHDKKKQRKPRGTATGELKNRHIELRKMNDDDDDKIRKKLSHGY
jgi:hypothetical protein